MGSFWMEELFVRDGYFCASGNLPCCMMWFEQSFVIAESELDGSFPFPYVPISLIFIPEIVDAGDDVLLLPLISFSIDNLLLYMSILFRLWYGGAASIRIIV